MSQEYPKLATRIEELGVAHGRHITVVEVSEGVFEDLTPYWRNHPKFKEHLDQCDEFYEIFVEELNREILREIIKNAKDS